MAENKVLLAKEDIIIPETFDFKKVMEDVANRAWRGSDLSTREFHAVGGNISLVFFGHVYEPVYEYFTSGCNVYAVVDSEKQYLYSSNKKELNATLSKEEYDAIANFIMENMKMGIVEVAYRQ